MQRERRHLCDLRFLRLNLRACGNGSGNPERPAVENGLALILAFYPKEKESNPRITNGLRDAERPTAGVGSTSESNRVQVNRTIIFLLAGGAGQCRRIGMESFYRR